MISLESSGKLKRRRLLLVRRVKGESMLPTYRPGQIVLATGLFRQIKEGDVIIISHNSLEKIKRVQSIMGDKLYVIGDNKGRSTDSSSFGWLDISAVRAKVIRRKTKSVRA